MCAPRVELASERHALGTQLRSEIADGEIRGEIRDTHQNPHPKSGTPTKIPTRNPIPNSNPEFGTPTKILRTPEAKSGTHQNPANSGGEIRTRSGTPTKIPRTPGPCVESEIHPRCC